MESIKSVKYEVAHKIIRNLLEAGLITEAEFEAIDKENIKTFEQND